MPAYDIIPELTTDGRLCPAGKDPDRSFAGGDTGNMSRKWVNISWIFLFIHNLQTVARKRNEEK